MKTFRTTGTGNEQTLSEIETDKIPLYPTEQDLLDDLANLEVGQIAGTIDPAESELIGVLIQKIQALESKLESDDVYSTDEVKTNKKWIDGKPIYRKTYYSATGFGNGDVVIDTLNNVDMMISIVSISADSSYNYTQNYMESSVHLAYYNKTSKKIYSRRTGVYQTSYPSSIVIEYTKTTDD